CLYSRRSRLFPYTTLFRSEVVATLNRFWDLVVPAVSECGGHANKFIGDGLLAVFGAPERHRDHADSAVAAGLDIVRRVHDAYARSEEHTSELQSLAYLVCR